MIINRSHLFGYDFTRNWFNFPGEPVKNRQWKLLEENVLTINRLDSLYYKIDFSDAKGELLYQRVSTIREKLLDRGNRRQIKYNRRVFTDAQFKQLELTQ